MSKRALENIEADFDQIRLTATRARDVVTLVLQEGGKRPKLTVEERNNVEDAIETIKVQLCAWTSTALENL